MVTDGSYTCEHSIMYRLVESLHFTPETIVTLCVSCASIKKKILINSSLKKVIEKNVITMTGHLKTY